MIDIADTKLVVVGDRYLYYDDGDRFFMKGIAFPDPPVLKPPTATPDNPHPKKPGFNYNATAWIAILHQLRHAVPDFHALNTLRIYRLDPTLDYSEFFEAAASLGFYVLVPLTSNTGAAVLDRSKRAPNCYNPTLLEYGIQSWLNYGRYPNVLAGVIGNEVMNDLTSWYAAPCIKAYARDLKKYMQNAMANTDTNLSKLFTNRTNHYNNDQLEPLPLLYAAQHSGIGAAVTEVDSVRLAMDYLTCNNEEDDPDIDIFGINIESWCSTYQSFYYNQGGSISSYYMLYRGLLHGVRVPLVFSEMGCSHMEFDKDNVDIKTPEGTRDWRQVSVVLNNDEMKQTFSGFCAYGYYGTPLFAMMKGGPWDGRTPLEPTQDFENFVKELGRAAEQKDRPPEKETTLWPMPEEDSLVIHDLPMFGGGYFDAYYHKLASTEIPPTCEEVQYMLYHTCNLDLPDMEDMPSYIDAAMNNDKQDVPPPAMTASLLLPTSNHMDHSGSLDSQIMLPGVVVAVIAATTIFTIGLMIRMRNEWRRRFMQHYDSIP